VEEAKNRKPQNEEDGLQRFNGLWLDEKRHLQVRTLGHFSSISQNYNPWAALVMVG
jgi:hypothetical protein